MINEALLVALLCGKLFFSSSMKQLVEILVICTNSYDEVIFTFVKKEFMAKNVLEQILTSTLSNTTVLMNFTPKGIK